MLSACNAQAPNNTNGFDTNFSSLQATAAVEQNIAYGAGPFRTMDIYAPSHPAADRPVLIFFHGGLWQNSDKKDYGFVGQTMAARGVLTIVANYSQYPQAQFPEFLKDGADTVAWVRENIAAYGGNPRRVFLMGHSAGAYIAAMLALDPEYLARDGLTQASIVGVIGMAGLYDFLPFGGKPYAGVFQNSTPLEITQPVHYAASAAPPFLLIAGGKDDTVDPANTKSLAARITEKGGRARASLYPESGFLGLILPFSPAFHGPTDIVDEVTGFIVTQQDTNSAKTH